MIKRLLTAHRTRSRSPFFTTEDRENITWFWHSYLKKRTPWLLVVFGMISVQGIVYQQFLRMTESGLRVIFDQGSVADLVRVCAMVFGLFTVRAATSYVIPRL
ncbi:MAG: ABC transporter ATP-binding protein, partial [Mangrovicoccus sp.]|nr:ABC transporter ATP-binding protein [Mangrovicoccus sp.]